MKHAMLSILLFVSVSLYGGVGNLTFVKGEVGVQRGSELLVATAGMVLEQKDSVITKKDAKAQVVMSDKTSVSIGPESDFSIEKYLYDEKSGNNESEYAVKKGILNIVTGQIGKVSPDKFKLKTYTATMGIRGTQFIGAVNESGDKWYTGKGTIFVEAQGVSVDVKAGYMSEVKKGEAPQKPRKYDPKEYNDLLLQTTMITTGSCPVPN